MATAPPTLRDRQLAALQSLLALNSPTASPSTSHGAQGGQAGTLSLSGQGQLPTWKVLVMDKVAQDVLATSLRVQDLRAAGVTLHL